MDLIVALAVALGATEGEEDKKAIISVIGDALADAFDFKAESASSSMWGPAFPPCLSHCGSVLRPRLLRPHTHTHTLCSASGL